MKRVRCTNQVFIILGPRTREIRKVGELHHKQLRDD